MMNENFSSLPIIKGEKIVNQIRIFLICVYFIVSVGSIFSNTPIQLKISFFVVTFLFSISILYSIQSINRNTINPNQIYIIGILDLLYILFLQLMTIFFSVGGADWFFKEKILYTGLFISIIQIPLRFAEFIKFLDTRSNCL